MAQLRGNNLFFFFQTEKLNRERHSILYFLSYLLVLFFSVQAPSLGTESLFFKFPMLSVVFLCEASLFQNREVI